MKEGTARLKRSLRNSLLVLVGALALTACASAPVQEMSDARQAIEAARAAGGDHYTPETLTEARTLLNQATDDLARGEYAEARTAALQARQRAIFARHASLAVQPGKK